MKKRNVNVVIRDAQLLLQELENHLESVPSVPNTNGTSGADSTEASLAAVVQLETFRQRRNKR